MTLCPDCIMKCKRCVSHYTGGCLAGNGDDDFVEATNDWIVKYYSKRESKPYESNYRYRDALENYPILKGHDQ